VTRPFFNIGKRVLDLGIGTAALIVLFPVMAVVALLVWCTLGRPILFRQQRPGLLGRPFTILKFRTMKHAEAASMPSNDSERLSAVGRLLRSTSLDELPQLINVVKGEMSLVGPRPLLMQYLNRYTPAQARRHEVKPGLTGWAQINGRNTLSWEARLAMDVWYVDHKSFALDLTILFRTLGAVVKRRGISARGEATMPEFLGSER
jgi:lipopolysaccharide/colanic/teichoic acid biosynthesis glycosyltransferase